MKRDKKYFSGLAALFLAAASWGSGHAFVTSNLGVFSLQWLLVFRLGTAGLLLAILGFPKWKTATRADWKHGIVMGCIMYGIYFFFAQGVRFTATSRASFIVGAYIIFVPFVYILIRRKFPRLQDFAGTALCLIGLGVILLDSSFGGINQGDLLVGVAALFYSFHVVVSAKFAKGADTFLLNMIQLCTCGCISLAVALLTAELPRGLSLGDFSGPLYLAVVSTVLPYMCSLYGQKYVRTTTSAVILSFESVFGCLSSIILLGEKISLRFVVGAIIVMLSFFVTEGLGSKKKEEAATAEVE